MGLMDPFGNAGAVEMSSLRLSAVGPPVDMTWGSEGVCFVLGAWLFPPPSGRVERNAESNARAGGKAAGRCVPSRQDTAPPRQSHFAKQGLHLRYVLNHRRSHPPPPPQTHVRPQKLNPTGPPKTHSQEPTLPTPAERQSASHARFPSPPTRSGHARPSPTRSFVLSSVRPLPHSRPFPNVSPAQPPFHHARTWSATDAARPFSPLW